MYANYSATSAPIFSTGNSNDDVSLRNKCRLCESEDLSVVLKLTPTPPANAFVPPNLVKSQPCYPLDVYFCNNCTHLQLLHVVDPEVLFRHYVYVSGTSVVMRQHLQQYAQDAVERCHLRADDFVIEFGSNDGTLLREFKELNMRVLGIDPAENIAALATKAGIPTIPEFFNVQTAERILHDHGQAKLICANHCCAHIDDFLGVVNGVKILLARDGVWIFEVGYLLDVYTNCLFDTIYHEHVDFHTVLPLIKCFESRGLKLLHASRSSIQGGALRCYVGWAEQTVRVDSTPESVQQLVHAEAAAALHVKDTFLDWNSSINQTGTEVKTLLSGLIRSGKRIVGYGAPAKATTLMFHFGLTSHEIEYIVDDNELKQGLLSPGLHIPITSPARLYADRPEYVLLLAWNFADSIIEQHAAFLRAGGRFIVPLPNLRIIRA